MKRELSDGEALVLFDLLHEYGTKDDGRTLRVQHAAERNAVWALSAALEGRLVAPLQPRYSEILSLTRARLEEGGGPW
jgi:hypothetical protein